MATHTATAETPTRTRLTQACWPVFEFVTNFVRQCKRGVVPPPEQVRYEAISALRDAGELARDDPATERAWDDRVKAMMVYMIDYLMLNSNWDGRDFWFDSRLETDPDVLNAVEPLGGEKFFEDCDYIQKEYELAERRDRRDKYELGEQLGLYFICLRLGFKGQYHDRPQELADYTRRLFTRLPAYATTRAKEMFPEAYQHNQEIKVDYRLGVSLTIVLIIFACIVGASMLTFRLAWSNAVAGIRSSAAAWTEGRIAAPAPTPAGKEAAGSARSADESRGTGSSN